MIVLNAGALHPYRILVHGLLPCAAGGFDETYRQSA